jgi:hypothetical protein
VILDCNAVREHEAALAVAREAAAYEARPNALFCLPPTHVVRRTAHKIGTSKYLDGIVIPVILISCVLMAMEAPGKDPPAWMENWDRAALAIFTVEMAIKVVDLGLVRAPEAYLRDAWNCLDCFIVLTGYLDVALSETTAGGGSSLAGLKAMRLIRTLRPLRLISRAEGLKECFNCLVTSIPAGGQVSVLLAFGALGFAVLGVMIFSGKFHSCTDGPLWTAGIISSWTRTNETGTETILVLDWLDCVGGAGMTWMGSDFGFDDVPTSLKTLFEAATFTYQTVLVSSLMTTGRGLQPVWKGIGSVSIPACAFFVVWLVLGGLVVRRNFDRSFCRSVPYACALLRAGSRAVHKRGRRHLQEAQTGKQRPVLRSSSQAAAVPACHVCTCSL